MLQQLLIQAQNLSDGEERNSLLLRVLNSTQNMGVAQKVLQMVPADHPIADAALEKMTELKERPRVAHQVFGNTQEENEAAKTK